MRTIIVFSVLYLACLVAGAQTIRRVNNNPGVTGVNVYSSAQAAHDAAAANDILLIEPSDTDYGDLILTKPLKIYGNGYFLDVNTELRADDRNSEFSSIKFSTGSDGAEVYGIVASSVIYIFGVSNIRISRCLIATLRVYTTNLAGTNNFDVTGLVISQNYFTGQLTSGYQGGTNAGVATIENVLIANNIFDNQNGHGTIFTADNQVIQNWIVRNNDFYGNTENQLSLVNSVFENNLCSDITTLNFENVTLSYNVSSEQLFEGGVGNQNNVAVSIEFTQTGSDDEWFVLKPTSTLKTAGSAGVEVGAFGGTDPYVISGIPPIPSVTEMFNTGTGSDDVPLQVTISVQANN